MALESIPPTTSRRDRRKELTRARMLEAARTLITEKGVAGLRIGELTEHADVALGSFYNYFSSKEELVEAVVSESLATLAETIVMQAPEGEDPAVPASVAIRRFVRLAYDDPDFARLVVNLSHADTLFVTAVHPYARVALERGIDSGRFLIRDLEVALVTLVGGAIGLIRSILDGHHEDGAEITYADIVLRALGIPEDEALEISHRPLPEPQ
jgi:AcrR family transcriptional regulator